MSYQRSLVDLSLFTNPVVSLQADAMGTGA
jgi:hypothetical protein